MFARANFVVRNISFDYLTFLFKFLTFFLYFCAYFPIKDDKKALFNGFVGPSVNHIPVINQGKMNFALL
jgi:hypothetical protein